MTTTTITTMTTTAWFEDNHQETSRRHRDTPRDRQKTTRIPARDHAKTTRKPPENTTKIPSPPCTGRIQNSPCTGGIQRHLSTAALSGKLSHVKLQEFCRCLIPDDVFASSEVSRMARLNNITSTILQSDMSCEETSAGINTSPNSRNPDNCGDCGATET